MGDLEPRRADDHVALKISNPEVVDFGQAADKIDAAQSIVLPF